MHKVVQAQLFSVVLIEEHRSVVTEMTIMALLIQ